jgi:hypothetical protein
MTNQIAQGGVTGSITPVSPDPRITPVSSISISFSEPVSGFDIGDLILSRDGFSESLAGAILTDSGDHQNYTLSNLSGSTDRVGQFNLGFTGTTGITGNTSGDPFAAGSLEVWQMNGLNGTGANDVIKLVKNSGDNTLTDVYFNSGGSVAYSFKTATASNVQVFGNAGDDVLTIDYSLGQPLTNGGGSFDAGSNTATGDKLVWVGETGADAYTVTASSVNRTSPTAVPFGVSNNEALDFTTGTYTLVSDVGANVAVRIGPSTTAAFTSTQHVRDLVIENGALVNFMQNGNQRLVTSGLTLNGNGMLDMFDNDMILEYSGATPLATIENAIRFARNGGLWNTIGGITSTSARTAAQPNKTLGAIEASDWKTVVGGSALFDNEVVDNTSILVKYTYYGDYDFNGKVDGSDYARVDARFNDQLTFGNIGGWFNGDFDYNGKVDGGDYALIDGAYSSQSGTL